MSQPKFVGVGDKVTNRIPPVFGAPDQVPCYASGVVKEYLGQEKIIVDMWDHKFLVAFGDVEVVRLQGDLYWESKK